MVQKLIRAIIMGLPGSGKGTISERIVKDFPINHLASGDLLRRQVTRKTAVGLAAQKFIDEGHMVPDNVMIDFIFHELEGLESSSWLLDGFPRTVPQAEVLFDREKIDVVLHLEVPFQVIIDRIKGRWTHLQSGRIYHTEFNPPKKAGFDDVTGEPLVVREDDKPETVLKRLQHYNDIGRPVLDYFRKKGILEDFTGKFTNEIWPNVHKSLATRLKPRQFTEYK